MLVLHVRYFENEENEIPVVEREGVTYKLSRNSIALVDYFPEVRVDGFLNVRCRASILFLITVYSSDHFGDYY